MAQPVKISPGDRKTVRVPGSSVRIELLRRPSEQSEPPSPAPAPSLSSPAPALPGPAIVSRPEQAQQEPPALVAEQSESADREDHKDEEVPREAPGSSFFHTVGFNFQPALAPSPAPSATGRRRGAADKKKRPTAVATPAVVVTDELTISARGEFDTSGRFAARLDAALASEGRTLTPFQALERLAAWTRPADEALLSFLSGPDAQTTEGRLVPSRTFFRYQGQALQHLSLLDIFLRGQLVGLFNEQLAAVLPAVDLAAPDPSSLGARLRRACRYVSPRLKQPALQQALEATQVKAAGRVHGTEVPATLRLDNLKALQAQELGPGRALGDYENCFVQAFRQLRGKDSAVFRHLISSDRCFQVSFEGEAGVDAGGVFREGMSRIVEDLFSSHFPLLSPCPNARQALGVGADKFLPAADQFANDPTALEMFSFVGKLAGMSLRAKLGLPLPFPRLVWRKLLGEAATAEDLREIDLLAWKLLDDLERCDRDQFQREHQGKLRFVCPASPTSSSASRELVPGGAGREVTFSDRLEFCALVRAARLSEFDRPIAAMREGLAEVVPARPLLLFSAEELEELVCGSPAISFELWQRQTEVSGLSPEVVALFWKVLQSLSPAEQSGFIRFAWGRSRLPARAEDFPRKMKLERGGRGSLPVAHTCFFSVELPEYRTEEEMRHGLRTAIHFGVGGILNN